MMSNIDQLTLISGIDIPIPEIRVNIHQPTIREIAYVGERDFYHAASILRIDKEELSLREEMTDEDKSFLLSQTNFQILMSMISGESPEAKLLKVKLLTFLTLLFPTYTIDIEERMWFLNSTEGKGAAIIDENNFEVLQHIVGEILCLNKTSEEEFNPANERARIIAEKLKRGRAKAAALRGEKSEQQDSILSRYISGLSIGTNSLDINKLLELTLYQLFDQLERYGLYTAYDISMKARMAGASDVEDVDWLKNIH